MSDNGLTNTAGSKKSQPPSLLRKWRATEACREYTGPTTYYLYPAFAVPQSLSGYALGEFNCLWLVPAYVSRAGISYTPTPVAHAKAIQVIFYSFFAF